RPLEGAIPRSGMEELPVLSPLPPGDLPLQLEADEAGCLVEALTTQRHPRSFQGRVESCQCLVPEGEVPGKSRVLLQVAHGEVELRRVEAPPLLVDAPRRRLLH